MYKYAKEIREKLEDIFPTPHCELKYNSIYELLVAVMLSAQCTDKRVNIVTEELFKEYNTPLKMISLKQEELEEKIHSCGFYHNKAKNILSMSKDVIEKYNGIVPKDLDNLQKLAGVGRKTANVVMAEGFKGDAIAVDTHVLRVSNRLGLANTDNPIKCEQSLMKQYDKKYWSKLHLQIINFGRQVCKARNPQCDKCELSKYCMYYNNSKHNI